jgi:hypothetical protein
VTPISILDFDAGAEAETRGATLGPLPPGYRAPASRMPTDAIALCRPWHFWGAFWGIYFGAETLIEHTWEIAFRAGASPDAVAPFVARQILDHERAHFCVEVAATYMEDAARPGLYRPYMTRRFNTALPPFGIAPLEEAFATSREVRGRTFARTLGAPPPGFWRATRDAALAASPGYADWPSWKIAETSCACSSRPHFR